MRWDDLFSDLEAQLSAADAAELAAEVAERTRHEAGQLRLADRARAALGAAVQAQVSGLGVVRGTLADAGPDWWLLREAEGRDLLVATAAVLSASGLGGPADVPGSTGELAHRLDFRWALKALVRSRSGVHLALRDGSLLTGTLDRVGADHVDLADHAVGEARRRGAVRQVRLVPLVAVSAVRSAG